MLMLVFALWKCEILPHMKKEKHETFKMFKKKKKTEKWKHRRLWHFGLWACPYILC